MAAVMVRIVISEPCISQHYESSIVSNSSSYELDPCWQMYFTLMVHKYAELLVNQLY